MIKRMSEDIDTDTELEVEEEQFIDLDERRICVDYPRYSVFRIGSPKERIYDNENDRFVVNVWKFTNHKGKPCEKKYWCLELFDEDGVKHKVRLSRIVSNTWIPNPNDKPIVDHINGDSLDDCIENLRLGNSIRKST